MRSVAVFIGIINVFVASFSAVGYSEEVYEFGTDCEKYSTKYLDEFDKIYVEYTGKDVDILCDTFQFKGRGYNLFDDYEVCLTQVYFNDSMCAVTLNIKSSSFSSPDHTIMCNSNTDEKYCGSEGEVFTIQFRFTSILRSSAKFRFLITANKVSDSNSSSSSVEVFAILFVGVIIGAIILIAVVICFCVCRRRPTQGRTFPPVQGTSPVLSQLPVQQQTTRNTYPQPPTAGLYTGPPSYDDFLKNEKKYGIHDSPA
uniref:Uncharacterized protein LOC111107288 isoform X2 n=1 Tax=Crassostrea virginica TaxID=6565 RepID=A0A8B8B3Y6_CRAVI|nr:uncharacterized protein LOC111107288 isoform X2 [Crassostrea virginica]